MDQHATTTIFSRQKKKERKKKKQTHQSLYTRTKGPSIIEKPNLCLPQAIKHLCNKLSLGLSLYFSYFAV